MDDDIDLRHHGDTELAPGLVDLAVNVRPGPMPAWLARPLAASLSRLGTYPDQRAAIGAVAARHGRDRDEVLLTAGAAEAFVLLARALRPRRPVVVHPQFTEAEAALRVAGHPVERVVLGAAGGFTLDPAVVPTDADLVLVGNPTNPTSVAHHRDTMAALARPGRVLVIDEAFADTVYEPERPPEPTSLADRRDLPGLVVVRSLTKTWALAGLRVGYLVGDPTVLARLATAQPLWPLSTPALTAIEACTGEEASAAAHHYARALAGDRAHLVARLSSLGVAVAGVPASSFLLVHHPGADRVRLALRERGYAVRRGDTFPGLGPDWLRIAVRDRATTDAFIDALSDCLDGSGAF